MSTGYNRLKKYRQLKTPADEFTTSSESLNINSQLESQNDESSIDVPMEIDVIYNYSSSHESANRNNTCTNYDYGSNNDDNLSDLSYSSLEDGIRSPDDNSHESSSSDCVSIFKKVTVMILLYCQVCAKNYKVGLLNLEAI